RSGRCSLGALRRRVLGRSREPDVSLVLVAFDLLLLGGDTSSRPSPTNGAGGSFRPWGWRDPGSSLTLSCPASEGPALFSATKDQGLEGVVAKRLGQPLPAGGEVPGLGQGQARPRPRVLGGDG